MGLSRKMLDEQLAEIIMPLTEYLCVHLRELRDKLENLEFLETFAPRAGFMQETRGIDIMIEAEAGMPTPDLRDVMGLVGRIAAALQKTGGGLQLDKFEPKDVIKFPTSALFIERAMEFTRHAMREEEGVRGDTRYDVEKLKGAIKKFAIALKNNGVDLHDNPLNDFATQRTKFR